MKRTASILLVLALLLSFAMPIANAAETTNIVFSGAEENEYTFAVGPEPRTYTFDIMANKGWNMYGSFSNSDSAGRTWKWKGNGRTSLTLPLAENKNEDIGYLSYFSAAASKPYDYLGSFAVVQLSARDYTRFNAICHCGPKRDVDIDWSDYDRHSDADVRRLHIWNSKYHALINNDGAVYCNNCDGELENLFIFVLALPDTNDRFYGTENHNFAGGTVCTGCGYEREIKAKSITLSAPTKTLTLGGDGLQLTHKLKPANSNSTVTFSSGKTGVATVDENGLVTPVGAGTVTITAKTSSGKKATIKLTVVDPKKAVSVRIEPGKPLTLDIGQSAELSVVMLPVTAESALTWTASKKDIASVTPVLGAEGNVFAIQGLKKGVTWLTVKTENGKTSRIKVTVTKNIFAPPTP